MHNWAKRQEEVYSGRGFGETERSFKVNEFRFRVSLRYLGNPPKSVLDVGCNDGYFTEHLRQRGFEVVGVDMPEVIEKAVKRYPKCRFIAQSLDTEEWLLPDYYESFDFISALEIIEHMYYDAHFLRQMAYFLKKGGSIVITTPSTQDKLKDDHIRFYPLESLRKLLLYSNFEVVKLHAVGEYHIAIGIKNESIIPHKLGR